MKEVFFLLGLLAYFIGYIIFSEAKSAIHETVALLIIINGTLFIVGSGIMGALHSNKAKEARIVKATKTKQSEERIEPKINDISEN